MESFVEETDQQETTISERDFVPSVESDNREERIAARRLRIQARIESDRRAALGEPPQQDVEKKDPNLERKSKQQIQESRQRLDKLITDGTQLVTNVQVAGDAREIQRRQDAAEQRKARAEKVETDATTSEERFEEIIKNWNPALQKSVPQELHDSLLDQKASCDAMIEEKERLIGELQQELKDQDDRYVQDLKKQAEDVDLLLERMEEQVKTLAKSHKGELKEIEQAYETEYKDLLEQNRKEWQEAVADLSLKEVSDMASKEEQIEENEKTLHEMRIYHSEEFNGIKIKLETDIQNLQQQIQQMKATFQLNAEKLEYNLHILKKRDEENTLTISQQKRRITRLQDSLTGQRRKLKKQEKQLEESLAAVTEDYRRSVEQFTGLQKKFKYFMICDRKRFMDIWLMNEEEVTAVAQDVLKANEIIHCQQLGLEWQARQLPESPMTQEFAAEQGGGNKAINYAASIVSGAPSEADIPSVSSFGLKSSQRPVVRSPAVVRHVLDLLALESEFLVESKLYTLLAPLAEDEQLLMKLDAIFKALKIEKEADIHRLVEYFIVKEEPGTIQSGLGQDEDAFLESELVNEDTVIVDGVEIIDPTKVPMVLRSFVEDRQVVSGKIPPSSIRLKATSDAHLEDGSLLDGSYWDAVANLLPESNSRMASALADGLEKYHTTLTARRSLLSDCDSLRQQNSELRFLLQQYIQSKINDELLIPPTQLMTLDPNSPPATAH